MRCPAHLGLFTRARVVLQLAANELRIMLPCDTELDLVLVDCFTPPVVTREPPRYVTVERNGHEIVEMRPGCVTPNPKGVLAYEEVSRVLNAAPTWLRVWLPIPLHDREWFRHLVPQSKQLGHIWITPDLTLNEHLIATGHAQRVQSLPMSPDYDGNSAEADGS